MSDAKASDLPGITLALDIHIPPYRGPTFDYPGAVEMWESAIAEDQQQAARLYQNARDWTASGHHEIAAMAQQRAHGVQFWNMWTVDEIQEHRRASRLKDSPTP